MEQEFSDSSADSSIPWYISFSKLPGAEYFCEIDEEYIRDKFNLTYLEREVPNFKRAYDCIISSSSSSEILEESVKLYGMLHARYIISPMGLSKMYHKFRDGLYGHCPRVLCSNQALLPVGLSDKVGANSIKLYCPCCKDVYSPRAKKYLSVDGAYFGTSFPHIFLQTYGDMNIPKKSSYVPRIFGFEVVGHE